MGHWSLSAACSEFYSDNCDLARLHDVKKSLLIPLTCQSCGGLTRVHCIQDCIPKSLLNHNQAYQREKYDSVASLKLSRPQSRVSSGGVWLNSLRLGSSATNGAAILLNANVALTTSSRFLE